jgi:hypothetical protein
MAAKTGVDASSTLDHSLQNDGTHHIRSSATQPTYYF